MTFEVSDCRKSRSTVSELEQIVGFGDFLQTVQVDKIYIINPDCLSKTIGIAYFLTAETSHVSTYISDFGCQNITSFSHSARVSIGLSTP